MSKYYLYFFLLHLHLRIHKFFIRYRHCFPKRKLHQPILWIHFSHNSVRPFHISPRNQMDRGEILIWWWQPDHCNFFSNQWLTGQWIFLCGRFFRNYPLLLLYPMYLNFASSNCLPHLPYIVRFIIFNLLLVPSTNPLL